MRRRGRSRCDVRIFLGVGGQVIGRSGSWAKDGVMEEGGADVMANDNAGATRSTLAAATARRDKIPMSNFGTAVLFALLLLGGCHSFRLALGVLVSILVNVVSALAVATCPPPHPSLIAPSRSSELVVDFVASDFDSCSVDAVTVFIMNVVAMYSVVS
jgi:hypothetical protein